MFDLGIRLALGRTRTVCYVEREIPACDILAARMEDGTPDAAPIWSDLTTFDGRQWRGEVDLVIGGIPCQPFSSAGDRKGIDDHRWLWDDIKRVIGEVQPRACFFENVPGLVRGGGLGFILQGLAESGFDAEWDLFRASDVGAPHKRERLFILAARQGHDLTNVENIRRPPQAPMGRVRTRGRSRTWGTARSWQRRRRTGRRPTHETHLKRVGTQRRPESCTQGRL